MVWKVVGGEVREDGDPGSQTPGGRLEAEIAAASLPLALVISSSLRSHWFNFLGSLSRGKDIRWAIKVFLSYLLHTDVKTKKQNLARIRHCIQLRCSRIGRRMSFFWWVKLSWMAGGGGVFPDKRQRAREDCRIRRRLAESFRCEPDQIQPISESGPSSASTVWQLSSTSVKDRQSRQRSELFYLAGPAMAAVSRRFLGTQDA